MRYEHFPALFDQPDLQRARAIILTPEAGLSTEERWEQETNFLRPFLAALPTGLCIDFGCGVGRLSRVLIELGHPVLGVDASISMLSHALDGISVERFAVARPNWLTSRPLRAQSAIAVWVLQHARDPEYCINLIADNLADNAHFLFIGRETRYLPAVADGQTGWLDDRIDIPALIAKRFALEHEEEMPPELCDAGAWLRRYRKR